MLDWECFPSTHVKMGPFEGKKVEEEEVGNMAYAWEVSIVF